MPEKKRQKDNITFDVNNQSFWGLADASMETFPWDLLTTGEVKKGEFGIEIYPEEVLWSTAIDLGEGKKFKASLIQEERWVFKDESRKLKVKAPIRMPKYIDKNIVNIYNRSFLALTFSSMKECWPWKALASLGLYLFGGFDLIMRQYLTLAFLEVIVGIWADVTKHKEIFIGVTQRISKQILLLLLIVAATITTNITQLNLSILGKECGGREAFIVFFALTNMLLILEHAKKAGVRIPKALLDKLKATH